MSTPTTLKPVPRKAASWLRRLSFITAGAVVGVGVALWLLPEEDPDDEDGFGGIHARAPFRPFGVDDDVGVDGDAAVVVDEDVAARFRHRRWPSSPFVSSPRKPSPPPRFLAHLTVSLMYSWIRER